MGLPLKTTQKLELVQDAVVHMLNGQSLYCHAIPLYKSCIGFQMQLNVLATPYKVLYDYWGLSQLLGSFPIISTIGRIRECLINLPTFQDQWGKRSQEQVFLIISSFFGIVCLGKDWPKHWDFTERAKTCFFQRASGDYHPRHCAKEILVY